MCVCVCGIEVWGVFGEGKDQNAWKKGSKMKLKRCVGTKPSGPQMPVGLRAMGTRRRVLSKGRAGVLGIRKIPLD